MFLISPLIPGPSPLLLGEWSQSVVHVTPARKPAAGSRRTLRSNSRTLSLKAALGSTLSKQ